MFYRVFATILFILISSISHANDGARSLSAAFTPVDPPWAINDVFFKDGQGQGHTLRDFLKNELRGHYVLLNLWATWCAPCAGEMSSLDKLNSVMAPRNLTVIALSIDREGGIKVPAFYRRFGLSNLKVFWDPSGAALRRLHVHGIPTSIIINPKGEEIGRVSKYIDWARPDNLAFLDRIIGNTKRSQAEVFPPL